MLIAVVIASIVYSVWMELRRPLHLTRRRCHEDEHADLPRMQHIIASGFVAGVGVGLLCQLTQEPAEAFLFPRLISTVFVVLAFWTFGKGHFGRTKVGNGLIHDGR